MILAVQDHKPRAEFKRLKGNNSTEDKYVDTGNTWTLENATKEASNQNQTITNYSKNKPLRF